MRGVLLVILVSACGSVSATQKDAGGTSDTSGNVDTPSTDASTIDAPPALLVPRLQWAFEGNSNNTGSVSGFNLATPAGASYATGKVGMAISFGGGQYATVAGMKALLGNYGKLTAAFWLKEPGTLNSTSVFSVINRNSAPYGGVQFGFNTTTASLCVATTSNSLVSGGCGGPTAPTANAWHHWILRYDGSGTGTGQGGSTEIFVDNVKVYTQANDTDNNPVFTVNGLIDTLTLGTPGTLLDDVKIFDATYSQEVQCTQIIGGAYNGTGMTCTLP